MQVDQIFRVDDRFYLGEGVFETLKVANCHPCHNELHWQRLRHSAFKLHIPFHLSCSEWALKLQKCIDDTHLENGGLKVIVTSGRAARGLDAKGDAPSMLFQTFAVQSSMDGIRLQTASWRRDANNPIYSVKSINYLESILGRREALSAGADEVVFLNFNLEITETAIANLFLVKDGQVLTPSLSCGVLNGIARQRLLLLCQSAHIPCREVVLMKENLLSADAVFTTNALQGIRAVHSLDGSPLSTDPEFLEKLSVMLIEDFNCS